MLNFSQVLKQAKELQKACYSEVHAPVRMRRKTRTVSANVMRIHLGIQPDTVQQEVIDDEHKTKVCVWGRQRGKTVTALLWLLKRCIDFPGTIHWYVAPTYKQAKHIAWDKALSLFPRELFSRKPNETTLLFTFANGSKLYLMGAEDPNSLRGPSLKSVVLDEYGTMKRTAWSQGIQPTLAATGGHAFFIGTPNALKGPHLEQIWRDIQSGKIRDGYWKHQKTKDGAHITDEVLEDARRQLREWEFQQEYEAEFKEIAGRVWPEFVDRFIDEVPPGHKVHAEGLSQIPAPNGWDVICGIDHGYTHPLAAIWIAVGPSGQIQVVAEYSAPGRRYSEHATEIKQISELYGGISNVIFVGDPSAPQLAEEFLEEGIIVTTANNSVDRGTERVGRLMLHGYITVGACCTNLIKGIMHYIYDPKASRPRILKEGDDECDAFRYAVMEACPPQAFSRTLAEEDARIDSWEEDEIFTEQLLETNWTKEDTKYLE